ncbi:MAG: thermonuclease family protein [Proteobacteria bacterium]|nr:thermonuclease family protein [Pseudomonadota bacterium]MCP4919873.1 thermonuclease family protein [Pseudomonadota bacterium]
MATPLLTLVLLAACSPFDERIPMFGESAEFEACDATRDATVGCVIDGDTLDLETCGGERIRLLGVDTPEVHEVEEPDCYGPEASQALKDLLSDEPPLTLQFDELCTDTYGRTLAYVFAEVPGSGTDSGLDTEVVFLNEYMLSEGYARFLEVGVELRRRAELMAAEQEAKEAGRGLWGACE